MSVYPLQPACAVRDFMSHALFIWTIPTLGVESRKYLRARVDFWQVSRTTAYREVVVALVVVWRCMGIRIEATSAWPPVKTINNSSKGPRLFWNSHVKYQSSSSSSSSTVVPKHNKLKWVKIKTMLFFIQKTSCDNIQYINMYTYLTNYGKFQ